MIGVCVFHVLHDQWRLLFTSAYLWYLTVLAVGGMVAAGFYNPLQAPKDFSVLVPLVQVCVCLSVCLLLFLFCSLSSSLLSSSHRYFPGPYLLFSPSRLPLILYSFSSTLPPPFTFSRSSSPFPLPFFLPPPPPNFLSQSLRLPRLLRLFSAVKKFFLKILGDGTRLFVVILMTLVFLVWFAVINMQLFGYLRPEPECENFDNQFSGLTNVSISLIPRPVPGFEIS